MTFDELERRYVGLRGRFSSGELSEAEFRAAMEKLTLEDAQGRTWTIGSQSGQWYVFQEGSWVQADPPRAAEAGGAVCPQCGAAVELGAAFCVNCGHALRAQAPTAPQQAAAAPRPASQPVTTAPPAAAPTGARKRGGGRALLIGGLVVVAVLALAGLAGGAYLLLTPRGQAIPLLSGLRGATITPAPQPITPTPEILPPTDTPGPTETAAIDPTDTPPPTETVTPGLTAAEHVSEGDDLVLESRFEEAIERYQGALKIDPEHALAYAGWARALTFQGYLQAREDLTERAVEKAEKACELDRWNVEACAILARAYDWMEDFDRALEAAEWAVGLDPDHAEAQAYFSEVWIDLDGLEWAKEGAAKALELDPACAEAHRSQGWIHWMEDRMAEGLTAFERAAELEADLAVRHHELGGWYRELENADEAIAAFERAIALYPASARSHSELGWTLYEEEAFGDALRAFERGVAVNDAYVSAQWGLGQTLHAMGACERAIPAYERVVELNPEADIAITEMGWCHYELGDLEAARDAAERALELTPSYQDAHDLLAAVSGTPTPSSPTGELVIEVEAIRDTYSPGEDAMVAGRVMVGDEMAHGADVCLALIDKHGTQLVETCDITLGEFANIPTHAFSYGEDIPAGYTGELKVQATASYGGATARDTCTFAYQVVSAGPLSFEEPYRADAVESVPGGVRVTVSIDIEGGAAPFTVYHDTEAMQTWQRQVSLVVTIAKFPLVKTITVESADGQRVSHDYYIGNPEG